MHFSIPSLFLGLSLSVLHVSEGPNPVHIGMGNGKEEGEIEVSGMQAFHPMANNTKLIVRI